MASGRLLTQQDFFKTSLSSGIELDTTTIPVNVTPAKTEGYLVLEQDDQDKREVIYYTSVGSGTVLCPASGGRGLDGTTAQSHDSGAEVVMDDVAEYFNPLSTLLADYRSKCGLSVTGGTDDIAAVAGNLVINGSICVNATSETLSDIGIAGTNKSGDVASGGYRYIYAQDDGDGTWSLYVSNNTSESGKRRLGFAKFVEGSTTIIRYIYNDDDFSPMPRGMVIEWNGPISDIPQGFALCDGTTTGTPDCRDKFVITAGTTYSFGTLYGAATINLSHAHTVNSHGHNFSGVGDHAHYVNHTHQMKNHSHHMDFNTGNESGNSQQEGTGNARCAEEAHHHNVIGDTQGPNDNTSDGSSSGDWSGNAGNHHHNFVSEAPGTNAQLSSAQSIIPPCIALVRLMKL